MTDIENYTQTDIQEDIDELNRIKTSLTECPDEEKCKKLAKAVGAVTNRLKRLRSCKPDSNPAKKHCGKLEWFTWPSFPWPKTTISVKQTVQILNRTQTEVSGKFIAALEEKMNDFNFTSLVEKNVLCDKLPLIVVCISQSRLRPDVDHAIYSVRRSSPYVVIILHIGPERNLPQLPSERKLQYNDITFIDMGFNDQDAIFECRHNTKASVELRSYIEKFEQKLKEQNRTEGPILSSEPVELLSDTPWRRFCISEVDLDESVRKSIRNLTTPKLMKNILLLGPEKAGKSSFISSCLQMNANKKIATAKHENAECSHEMLIYDTNGAILGNVKLMRFKGKEPEDEYGCHPKDISYILQGNIMKEYEFDDETTREKPEFGIDEIHCVVFVIDAKTIYDGNTEAHSKEIKIVQDKVKSAGIKWIVILTKVDLLCNKVHEDPSNIFRSLKLEEVMKKASEALSTKMDLIHPVINYKEGVERSTAKDIPILLALHQIMLCAWQRVEFHPNDSESKRENGEQ